MNGAGAAARDAPVERRLLRDGLLTFTPEPIAIQLINEGVVSDSVVYRPGAGQRLEALAGPLDLRIGPAPGAARPFLCL